MPLKQHIIIADEQSLCREGLAALLKQSRSDLTIAKADRFAGVVAALSSDEAITLAIVDLALPGLTKIAGIRHLRAHFPNLRIAVTAAVLPRDVMVDCLRAGVHGCIAKSLPADEIVEAIETIAKGRIYVPAAMSDHAEEVVLSQSSNSLSERQREVLTVLAEGKSNKEIARHLGIAEGTVKVHVNAVFRALGVHNRVGAAAALKRIAGNAGTSEPASLNLLHPDRRASERGRAESEETGQRPTDPRRADQPS